MKTEWNPGETAPKDRPFLAKVGWPNTVTAAWCEADDDFVFAMLAVDNIQVGPSAPLTMDAWFENEHISKIEKWMELPR